MAARDDVERILRQADDRQFKEYQDRMERIPPPATNMGFDPRSQRERFMHEVLLRYDRFEEVRLPVCRILGVMSDQERATEATVNSSHSAERSAHASERSAAAAEESAKAARSAEREARFNRGVVVVMVILALASAIFTGIQAWAEWQQAKR